MGVDRILPGGTGTGLWTVPQLFGWGAGSAPKRQGLPLDLSSYSFPANCYSLSDPVSQAWVGP